MEIVRIRTLVTIMATIIAIIFITLSFFFPRYSVLLLSIEVVLLPAVYIIGNSYAENQIKQGYEDLLNHLSMQTQKLYKELDIERFKNRKMNRIAKRNQNAGKEESF